MAGSRGDRGGGFTLVELLIAVAIGSMLVTMVFLSLNSMITRRQAIVGFSTPYAIGPQILDTIEADLKNAYFYDFEDNDAFWGADGDLGGREADGISFIASSLGHVGEQSLLSTMRIGQAEAHRRRSPTTEVQYVCRQSPVYPECLELWRREDFYVDDSIHEGGIYRLVYDRVFDFKLEYIGRSTTSGGLTGSGDKAIEAMRRDGWGSMEERGLPRAVIVSIAIYAREPENTWEHEPQVFVFRRWIPLPQVHQSSQSEGQIATWDGKIVEGAGSPVGPGKGGKGGKGGQTTVGGKGKAPAGGANPFSSLLGNRAPPPQGGGGGFSDIFRPR